MLRSVMRDMPGILAESWEALLRFIAHFEGQCWAATMGDAR